MESAISFSHHVPSGRLGRFVEIFWYWEGAGILQGKELALPSSGTELVLDLAPDADARDSVLSGPHSRAFAISGAARATCLLGVHFRAGGAHPFLPVPAGELQDAHVALEDLFGRAEISALLENLHIAREKGGAPALFRVLESWLRAHLRNPLIHHPAVAFALEQLERAPTTAAAELADAAGLSHRRFIEVFRGHTGLAPKLYSRVGRFQRTIRALGTPSVSAGSGAGAGAQSVDWAEVAVRGGYFDQSHLIHEFRELCGLTPSRYLARRTEHFGHLPA